MFCYTKKMFHDFLKSHSDDTECGKWVRHDLYNHNYDYFSTPTPKDMDMAFYMETSAIQTMFRKWYEKRSGDTRCDIVGHCISVSCFSILRKIENELIKHFPEFGEFQLRKPLLEFTLEEQNGECLPSDKILRPYTFKELKFAYRHVIIRHFTQPFEPNILP